MWGEGVEELADAGAEGVAGAGGGFAQRADAPIRAAQRADELLAAGGIEGRTVWWQILAAVEELTGTRAPCQLN